MKRTRYSKLQHVIWGCYPHGRYPNGEVMVSETGDINIGIYIKGPAGYSMVLPRKFARMLARRINEALDAK